MKPNSHKTSLFNPKNLLIDHTINFKFNSDISPFIKHEKDENEQKLLKFISDKEKFKIKLYNEYYKETVIFLGSKLKAMEEMNLDDECCFKGKIETRKINIDKDVFPKPKHSKNNKGSISPKKRINLKNNSKKKYASKNNKNLIQKDNCKIEKNINTKNINFIDDSNLDFNKEIKPEEMEIFFSDKIVLNSILDEMKSK